MFQQPIRSLRPAAFFCLFCFAGLLFAKNYQPLSDLMKKIVEQFDRYNKHLPAERIYLHLDKKLYKPGETVWFSAYLRNETDLKPSEQSQILYVELINPKGGVEQKLNLIATDGAANGEFDFSESVAGGLYKLRAYTQWQKNYLAEDALYTQEIQVQKVVLPRLKMKMDFERKAYGAGDLVEAKLELNSLSNKPLANQTVDYAINIDGKQVDKQSIKTDGEGKAVLRYQLPRQLNTPDGLINAMIAFEGQNESISRTIPIVLNKIDLKFYPEGGELVKGLESRVAFQALNEFGKPADVSGDLIDPSGKKLASFTSFHQGMGYFNLKPEQLFGYKIKLTSPAVLEFDVPEALQRGYNVKVEAPRVGPMKVRIRTTETEELGLFVQIRGQRLHVQNVSAKAGETLVEIPTGSFPTGVAQITVFDSKGIPRAERLAFVNYDKKLSVEITTDKKQYSPREKVDLTVKIKDERGIPIPAQFSLAVVDDKLLSFADDKSGHILSQLLLEQDLKEKVEEPRFYFDPKEEKGFAAVDYLLLTRGWRRFKWEEIQTDNLPEIKHSREITTIAGFVFDQSSKPIAKVEVLDQTTKQKAVTNDQGYYEFKNVRLSGNHQLVVNYNKMVGYGYVNDYGLNHNIYLYQNVPYPSAPTVEGARGGAMPRGNVKRAMAPQILEKEKGNRVEALAIDDAVMLVAEEAPAPDVQKPKPELPAEQQLDQPAKGVELQAKIADDVFFADKKKEARKRDIAAGDEDMEEAWDEMPMEKMAPQKTYHIAREFPAPVYKQSEPVEVRTDFRSTVFWKGALKTDRTGIAKISFYNNDDVTSFRAVVEGVSVDGLVGYGEAVYFTQLPFSMDVKAPILVSMGDAVKIPLAFKNNTNMPLIGDLTVKAPSAWKAAATNPTKITVAANSAQTTYLVFEVQNKVGKEMFEASFVSPTFKDAFKQEVETGAKGFPAAANYSGSDMDKTYSLNISNLIAGTMGSSVTVYPSPLSEMVSGLESMLREPSGCFEQTSSSAYPNIMVMRYLKENDVKDEKIMKRASDLLDKGYKRLVTFETPEKGFEWFGGAPGHEALTAYGLLEYKDMQGVYAGVDATMVDRTSKWLLERRDGKGGFKRNDRALDSFGRASEEITNAYIVYSLTEAGYADLGKELDAAYQNASKSDDPYLIALVANALYNAKDKRADEILAKLIRTQDKDGSFNGKTMSITCSSGLGLKVETTSLAILATLKNANPDKVVLTKSVQALVGSKGGWNGGYGSTQSTILALKALTAFTKFSKRTAESGTIEVYVDGKKVTEKAYEAGHQGPIELKNLEQYLSAGKHDVRIKFTGCKEALPYSFNTNWATYLPVSSSECKVGLTTKMGAAQARMGETVRLTATLTNKTKDGLPMTIAVIGLPGGLTPQPYQLKELQDKKVFDYYELIGNRLAVYYRQMTPNEQRVINLDLKADLPGDYESPASTAYLYYTAEHRVWQKAERVKIAAN